MNDNTIIRIKVPAHLYESVKAKLMVKEETSQLQKLEEAKAKIEKMISEAKKVDPKKENKVNVRSQILDKPINCSPSTIWVIITTKPRVPISIVIVNCAMPPAIESDTACKRLPS